MLAGPTGYTTQEIVDKANTLKLTGEQPWDANKKAYVTTCIRSWDMNVHVGR